MIDVDAFILIGGRSSRLGRDKAVAEVGGKTLAQRAFQTATEAFPNSRVTFVAANEAQFGIDAIISGGQFIFDLIPDRGRLAVCTRHWLTLKRGGYSFWRATTRLSRQSLIRFLAVQIRTTGERSCPNRDGRLQPLCAFYKTDMARPVVQDTIDRPRVPPPMNEIVKELKPRIVKFSEFCQLAGSDAIFSNINTPEHLERAQQTFDRGLV